MLANATTLSFCETKKGEFKNLDGLQEIPELGVEPEKVDITCLSDTVKQYEMGIGDAGDISYTFLLKDENDPDGAYQTLLEYQNSGTSIYFKQTLKGDGMSIKFKGQPSVKLGGGGVNTAMTFTLNIALQSGLEHEFKTSAGV